jgi:hypothetical protein
LYGGTGWGDPRFAASRDTETVEARQLGQMVLEYGLLNEEQLELALAEHLSTGVRLGEILARHGFLTQKQLDWLLEEQAATAAMRQLDGARGIELSRTSAAEARAALEPETLEPDDSGPGHVLFVWNASGYALLGRAGEPPQVGSEVGVSGGRRVVVKLGPSPLPGDPRRCAYLDAL